MPSDSELDLLEYFGIAEKPYNPESPDPRFLVYTSVHRRALERVLIGVDKNQERLLVVYGPIGSGKTTLARRLLQLLQESKDNLVGMVLSPSYRTENALLRAIMEELEVPLRRSYAKGLRELEGFIVKTTGKGTVPILIVDEAQALKPKMLVLLRHIHNFVDGEGNGLRMVLFGQEEELFSKIIRRNPAFLSRVRTRRALDTLEEEDTVEIVRHRWRIAGGRRLPFSEVAMKRIHEYSGGIVRDVCKLCDEALLAAYTDGRKMIEVKHIAEAYQELNPETDHAENGNQAG